MVNVTSAQGAEGDQLAMLSQGRTEGSDPAADKEGQREQTRGFLCTEQVYNDEDTKEKEAEEEGQ